MNILLIGSGGREHALAWKLARSPLCEKLFCAPGNAGIAGVAECVALAPDDRDAIAGFAARNSIGLVVIGPEAPLAAGLADRLRALDIPVFGPSAAAARLEGSKGFMKDLCAGCGVPTAAYGRFTDIENARRFIEKHGAPIVVKADGLAAGKGVVIAQTVEEAIAAAADMLSGKSFGAAGASIVVEEFLNGEELSFFALSDGKTVIPFGSAQDHKRVGDGDTGPNTGGMGAYSPAPMMTDDLEKKIMKTMIEPVVKAMADSGCPFTGVLFAGIMMVRGAPKLLEFNVRFGDPECQTLMMRLENDPAEILLACAQGRLREIPAIRWRAEISLCVVMAAKGYPDSYEKGTPVGLPPARPDVEIFHAATKRDNDRLLSDGGRVLGVTALGLTVREAQEKAYGTVDAIDWKDGFCRRDIGWRAVADTTRRRAGGLPESS